MKRRLSTAVALIGSPPVLILDEPTAGVDPEGRKLLWNIIKSIKNLYHSIIVSTHDIEEYGELCTSFGIMLGGKMEESGNVVDVRPKYTDILVGNLNYWGEYSRFLTFKAIASKYLSFVDKFGCDTESDPNYADKDHDLWWLSLRSKGNRETQDKFKQKVGNELMLRQPLGTTIGNYFGFRSMELVQNFLLRALQHLTLNSVVGSNGEYEEFPDIEHQMDGNERHHEETTTAGATNYTVAQLRVWFKSQFNHEVQSNTMDGNGRLSEGSLNSFQAPSPAASVVDLFTVRLSNHLDFSLKADLLDNGQCSYSFEGSDVVNSHTCETFCIGKSKKNSDTEICCVAVSLQCYECDINLTIGCVPLGNGRFILSGGLTTGYRIVPDLLEAFLDLPTSPETWTTVIATPVAEQFESFAKFGMYLVRVEVPVGPRLEINAGILEIGRNMVEVEPEEVAKTRSILDRVFLDSNILFQQFYTQRLLSMLERRQETGHCIALIDIEHFLNVSLKNETENYASVEGDCSAGAVRMGEETNGDKTVHSSGVVFTSGAEGKGIINFPQTLNPPAEILPSTREIFYDCGRVPIQKMFSYEIESTDLSIIVGLKVQDKDSSFAFAFVQSSIVKNESFETLMDSSQLNNCPNRRFGYAKDGEKAIQVRNIIALVSMTEPKCEDTRCYWQCKNSQLSIKIFTI